MERQLLERMIGAVVLLVALVVIVPAILDGGPDVDDQPQPQVPARQAPAPDTRLRTHKFSPDRAPESPPVARQAQADTLAANDPSPIKTEAPVAAPKPTAAPQSKPTPSLQTTPPASPAEQPPQPRVAAAGATEALSVASAPAKVESTRTEPATIEPGWVVQLGSFSSRANAQGLADKTRAKGFSAYLMPIERSGKTLYRVRVGPPRKSRDEAARLADDLQKAGFKGQIAEQKADG